MADPARLMQDLPGGACHLPQVFNNKDEDVVALGTGSSDSGLLTCLVDGGAGEFPSWVAANDTNAKGKDGIDASGFGGTIIENAGDSGTCSTDL